MLERMQALTLRVQEEICEALGRFDDHGFGEDRWRRDEGGGGLSRVLQDGTAFHKAGASTATVWGTLSESVVEAMIGKREVTPGSHDFAATGLSVVIHPRNPHVPTVHCNYRYFELDDGWWWFGGGCDLTPIYLYEVDARHFHATIKEACDRHDPDYYRRFKSWCDEYFRLPHRDESRGIGGIFFDELRDRPAEEVFAFVADCAETFVPSYVPIVQRRIEQCYGDRERRWQQLRRGRYAEFNLMYDRGTRFGLRTGGRVESILMSMPLEARWEYGFEPEPDGPEARLLEVLRQPRDWVEGKDEGGRR